MEHTSVVQQMFSSTIRIGASNRTASFNRGFDGFLSCVQMFSEALDPATIHWKKYCPDMDQKEEVLREPCNPGHHFYDGQCYWISKEEKTYREAEVACLPKEFDSYRSQLMWTDNPKIWHHIAHLVQKETGQDKFFAGASMMERDGVFTSR